MPFCWERENLCNVDILVQMIMLPAAIVSLIYQFIWFELVPVGVRL